MAFPRVAIYDPLGFNISVSGVGIDRYHATNISVSGMCILENRGYGMDGAQGIPQRPAWHIITSEEVARIRTLLTCAEQEPGEQGRRYVEEIGKIITLIERRLV